MHKYFALFKTNLALAIEYRSNLIGIIVTDLVGFASIAVLWLSVFRTQSTLGGLTMSDTVLYYLFVPLIGFITQVNMAENVASEIRKGILSTHLLKPQNIWLQYIVKWVAAKVNALIVITPVYILVFLVVGAVYPTHKFSFTLIGVAVIIGLLAFVLSILMDLFFAWTGFWLDDIWWFRHFKYIIFGVLGGASFPFEFLPHFLRTVVDILPLKFMYYVPIQYLLGNRPLSMIPIDLLNIALWGGLIFACAQILWMKGITKYEAYGN